MREVGDGSFGAAGGYGNEYYCRLWLSLVANGKSEGIVRDAISYERR